MTQREAFLLMQTNANLIGKKVIIKNDRHTVRRFVLINKGNSHYGVDVVLVSETGTGVRQDLKQFLKRGNSRS